MTFKQEFSIGDEVYFRTGEADRGIITNWFYNKRENSFTYEVSIAPGVNIIAYEVELSITKTIY